MVVLLVVCTIAIGVYVQANLPLKPANAEVENEPIMPNPKYQVVNSPQEENIKWGTVDEVRTVDNASDEPGQAINPDVVVPQKEMMVDEVIAYGKELTAKVAKIFLTPGWLHIKYENQSYAVDPLSVLPDGSPVPTQSITDRWLLLDDEGYIVEEVTIDDTGDPATTQIVVFKDGIVTNLTFPELTSEQEPYKINMLGRLDFDTLTIRTEDGGDLDLFETEMDGEALIVFSRSDRFDSPMTLGKSSTKISGFIHQYLYSKSTGLPYMAEKYDVYPNGEMVLKQRTTYLTFEKVDSPPKEVQSYIEK
jgi:hypothetical protein